MTIVKWGLTLVSDNKTYSLIIPEIVQEQLRDIKSYIETTYFAEQAGDNTVNNILYGLERLEVFQRLVLTQMKEWEKQFTRHISRRSFYWELWNTSLVLFELVFLIYWIGSD